MDDTLSIPSPTSLDAPNHLNINTPVSPVEIPSISGSRYSVRLSSLDLDYSGPEGDFPDYDLQYDDPPHQPGKIEEALLSTSETASQRFLESQILFGPIAKALDLLCQTDNENMPVRNIGALNDLCVEFTIRPVDILRHM
ncbi:hypothetical protein EPUL_001121 [Erysiphe pulchra]|uniref:Uncharacterized protein n=1 Tax=Erysiphe pulchra TaxID=225359 RepID=A0A2S4PY90_9PEZI|nr:hypothetical protein EPUL_001121 [Erysiphe pulchra]